MINTKSITNESSLDYNNKIFGKNVYTRELINKAEYKYSVSEVVIPSDWTTTWLNDEDLMLINLDGRLTVDNQLVKRNQTVIIPTSNKVTILTDAIDSVHALIVQSPSKTKLDHPLLVDHDSKIWELYDENGKLVLHLKNLLLPDITHIA